METLIDQFKMYRYSHPNIANCWLAYLELKKRHYEENQNLAQQGLRVLDLLANGYADLPHDVIVRLLVYHNSI